MILPLLGALAVGQALPATEPEPAEPPPRGRLLIGPLESLRYIALPEELGPTLETCYDVIAPGAQDWREIDGRLELRVVVRQRSVQAVTVVYEDSGIHALTPCIMQRVGDLTFEVRAAQFTLPVEATPPVVAPRPLAAPVEALEAPPPLPVAAPAETVPQPNPGE